MIEILMGFIAGGVSVGYACFHRMNQLQDDFERIAGVSTLDVKEGDDIVVTLDMLGLESRHHVERAVHFAQRLYPNNRVIVCDRRSEIKVINNA